jgi:hypothetical protein
VLGIRQGGASPVCVRADRLPHLPQSLTYEFARLVGWAIRRMTTTLDLYSHVTETMQVNAARRLDIAFGVARTQHKTPR